MKTNLTSNILSNGFRPRREKFSIGSLMFMLLFSTIFIGAGWFFIDSSKVDPNWTVISGEVVDSSSTISDGSTTYAAVIEYGVNGQKYHVASSLRTSRAPSIGEKREIAYNPSQPTQAKVVENISTIWWVWIFPIIGVIILVGSLVSFVKSLRRSKNINSLTATGHKLQGVLIDIQSDGGNRNSSYQIVVSATNPSGTVQNYVSDSLDSVGGLLMIDFRTSPVPIDVYIDPADPQNYYVDITDIPNLTPERIGELIQSIAKPNQYHSIVNTQSNTPPSADSSQEISPKL